LQLPATTTKLIMSISSCSLWSTRKLVVQAFYSKLIPPDSDLRIWSHNIVNCYSWLLTQLLIILSSTLITHSELNPSSSSSSPPPPPPSPPPPPPAVRHGHDIQSFRSFAMGTHTCPWS
jgi:hypothetical protein